MCKKSICVVLLALLAGLALPRPAGAADPGLVGWWKFDGDGLDASGNGRAGTLAGDAHYEAGYSGQALGLDGDGDSFSVTGWKGLMSTSAVTVTAWVKTTASGDATMVYWGRNSGTRRVDFRLGAGRLRVEHGSGNIQGNTALNNDQWHHVALAMPAAAQISYPFVKLYLDGQDDTRNTSDPDAFNLVDHASNVDLTFGVRAANGDRFFPGLIDEVRIFDRELVGAEIQDIMKIGYLASPHSPSPADGAKIEDTWGTLTWTAGALATSHNLYFSTSYDDVAAGADAALVGNLTTNSQPVGFAGFPAPDGLVPGTTYYWRVDEVNPTHPDSPWRGPVWSFWIPPVTAYDPVPADGSPVEPLDVDLSWSLGLKGIMHAVYFGTDKDQVANATGAAPIVSTTFDPGSLASATTYYWRVDTFNGAAWITGPVWTFTTMPVITVADPNLVGWWTFDEGAGATAADWSGHGNHGKIEGSPQWVDGFDGTALKFDGVDDLVNCGDLPSLSITGNITVMCWIKVAAFNRSWETILAKGDNSYRMSRGPQYGSAIHFGCNGPSGGNLSGFTTVTTDTWRHVALVYDGVNKIIYIDGVEDTRVASAGDISVSTYPLYIGANSQQGSRNLTGLVDDVRIYNKALTPADIQLVRRIDLKKAWNPKPVDGSTRDVETAAPLTWSRGDNATQHAVYFGTDATAVADANSSDTTGVYRGQQAAASYTPAEGVAWGGGPYYWRVDEINNDSTVTKGRVWSFSVADYLIVDDIESYNDLPETEAGSHRIYLSWIDGFGTTTNGALVGNLDVPLTERANLHGGSQAMPLSYDNNLKFSEATLTLTSGNDWTRQGVVNLSLWYRGAAANAPERMYVALNGTAVVYHPDPAAVQTVAWTEWVIPLQDFAAQGVNLTNVTSITIGFGTRGNTTVAGGTGQMYFDDIRLVRAATP